MRLYELRAAVETWLAEAEDQDCPPVVWGYVRNARIELERACEAFYDDDDEGEIQR